jgi:Uma2 family endonuclease
MNPVAERSTPRYENLKVTREEYLDLVEDGFRYDMEGGVLKLSPSSGFDHADQANQLNYEIKKFLDKKRIGKVVMECDILLPDGGDVLRPDITVILNENLGIVKTHIHGVPDLVVEVLSPSTRLRDLGEKSERYLKNGVPEYWIVDPESHRIEVRYNRKTEWEAISDKQLKSEVLPGLVVEAIDIFT